MKLRKIGIVLAGLMMVTGVVSASTLASRQQIDVLARTGTGEGGWFVEQDEDEHWDKWQYAVTDLNHDGNLEILKARSSFYDGKARLECEELTGRQGARMQAAHYLAGSAHVPDVLSGESASQPEVIHEVAGNRYYYIFLETLMHGEFESDTSQYAVCLDGALFITELATMNWQLSGKDGGVKRKYYVADPLKEEVSEERYINAVRERFPGAEEKSGQICWLSAEELQPYLAAGAAGELLQKSFDIFMGK